MLHVPAVLPSLSTDFPLRSTPASDINFPSSSTKQPYKILNISIFQFWHLVLTWHFDLYIKESLKKMRECEVRTQFITVWPTTFTCIPSLVKGKMIWLCQHWVMETTKRISLIVKPIMYMHSGGIDYRAWMLKVRCTRTDLKSLTGCSGLSLGSVRQWHARRLQHLFQ